MSGIRIPFIAGSGLNDQGQERRTGEAGPKENGLEKIDLLQLKAYDSLHIELTPHDEAELTVKGKRWKLPPSQGYRQIHSSKVFACVFDKNVHNCTRRKTFQPGKHQQVSFIIQEKTIDHRSMTWKVPAAWGFRRTRRPQTSQFVQGTVQRIRFGRGNAGWSYPLQGDDQQGVPAEGSFHEFVLGDVAGPE